MSGLLSRLFRRERPSPGPDPASPPPEWGGEEAGLRRQIRTLEVAFELRTISREQFEDRLRRLERRLGELDR